MVGVTVTQIGMFELQTLVLLAGLSNCTSWGVCPGKAIHSCLEESLPVGTTTTTAAGMWTGELVALLPAACGLFGAHSVRVPK